MKAKSAPASAKGTAFSLLYLLVSKDNTFVVVHDDTVFNMGFDGIDKDILLEGTALSYQIIHFVSVGDARNILFNDWSYKAQTQRREHYKLQETTSQSIL